MTNDRDVLLEGLQGPGAERARDELRTHPDWLVGPPPASFLDTLIVAYLSVSVAPLDIARAWDRPAMAQALLDRLVCEDDEDAQEALAWLLSQIPWAPLARDLVDLVVSPDRATIVRRWLATALDRIASGGEIGWPDVAAAVDALVNADESSLREAAAGICGSLPTAAAAHQTLLDLLDDAAPTVVASALQMLVLQNARLDTPRIRQLANHPNRGIAERATRLINLPR